MGGVTCGPEARRGSQGASHAVPEKSGLHVHGEGECVIALDSWEGSEVASENQGYCGVGRGLSGLHWVWHNGRGPHFELMQERQVSSTTLGEELTHWKRL